MQFRGMVSLILFTHVKTFKTAKTELTYLRTHFLITQLQLLDCLFCILVMYVSHIPNYLLQGLSTGVPRNPWVKVESSRGPGAANFQTYQLFTCRLWLGMPPNC